MDFALGAKKDADALIHPNHVSKDQWEAHITRILEGLKQIGANKFDMRLPETYALPYIIRADENIQGIIYGRYQLRDTGTTSARSPNIGRGVLLVTNHRVLFLDKKPSYLHYDEIPLDLISGITFTKAGIASRVQLHTRMGDYTVRTFNHHCATIFMHAIEAERLVTQEKEHKVSIKSHLQW